MMTQDDLGRMCGVCRPLVSHWEAGLLPRTKFIPKICKALGITPNELLMGWDDEE